jgi:N6-adenosine-specific RNA methylase IME4
MSNTLPTVIAQQPVSLHHNRVAYWADRICGQWRDSVEGILETGRSLIEAKKEFDESSSLAPGYMSQLLGRKGHPQILPFVYTAAYRIMKVSQDERIVQYTAQLPPSWETLALITRLTNEQFVELLEAGRIKPDLKQSEICKFRRIAKVKADEARVLGLQPREGKFRTLVVDIPWKSDTNWLGRSAPKYAQMSREEVLALPVASWADDNCHLYLCTTRGDLPLAFECMAAYGFDYKDILTWVKPPPFGLGKYFRGSTELCLFDIRGSIETRSNSIPTHFEAPRGEHSEKPEKFYEIVREASYPPYGEAFQRKARPDFVNLFVAADYAEAAE